MSTHAVPAVIPKGTGGGRAELDDKGIDPIVNVKPTDPTRSVEIQGEGRHGLRPEELDASGRYIGELHGDGRHINSSELP